jgi:hypothetical protein
MVNGVKQASTEGTPQGSPLSPLLANIMLDDLDRELERRGHHFVRYADDLRIHVKSERAGQRALAGVTEFIEKRLKLKVNKEKSSVKPGAKAVALGFWFYHQRGGRIGIRVAPKALKRMRQRLRELTGRSWRIAMPERIERLNRYIAGWCGYFAMAETGSTFEDVDSWLRRRLRQVRWVEWKRASARRRNLVRLGITPREARSLAGSSKGSWVLSHTPPIRNALPNQYWHNLGLLGFRQHWNLRHA